MRSSSTQEDSILMNEKEQEGFFLSALDGLTSILNFFGTPLIKFAVALYKLIFTVLIFFQFKKTRVNTDFLDSHLQFLCFYSFISIFKKRNQKEFPHNFVLFSNILCMLLTLFYICIYLHQKRESLTWNYKLIGSIFLIFASNIFLMVYCTAHLHRLFDIISLRSVHFIEFVNDLIIYYLIKKIMSAESE